jgi:hypothetical protein
MPGLSKEPSVFSSHGCEDKLMTRLHDLLLATLLDGALECGCDGNTKVSLSTS